MKVQNTSGSYGLLAGLLVLLLAAVATQSACCLHKNPRTAHVGEVYERGVLIQVTCLQPDMTVTMSRGSGVIVAPNRILTAGHVTSSPLCSYEVTAADGKTRTMRPKVQMKDHDLASMVITHGDPFSVPSVLYGTKPRLGEEVCSMSLWPSRTRKCGDVLPYIDSPGGDMRVLIVVEPGNSGSGLYNDEGRLVGIITARVTGVNEQTFEGRAASLQDHLAELLR